MAATKEVAGAAMKRNEGPALNGIRGEYTAQQAKIPSRWSDYDAIPALLIVMHVVCVVLIVTLFYGCAMSEEMRRIEGLKQAEQLREASRSTNLTGEQIFIRSCNSCHPNGKVGLGPSFEKLEEHFPDDSSLKNFIRAGRRNMPAQPNSVLNDKELDNLIKYLRNMKV